MAKRNFGKGGNSRDKEPKEFEEEVLQIERVTRVVKGGRRMRFRILVAIGDKKGRVAIGIGKAAEVVNGIKKAITQAKKALIRIPITDNGSIPHDVKLKYKSSRIMMMPAMPGTGIIAGGSLRKILMLAGVKNVFGKRFGTNNRMVTAQAAMLALQKLRPISQSKKAVVAEIKPHEGKAPHAEKAEAKHPASAKPSPETK
jgi:small subunit ribosomal protein S5